MKHSTSRSLSADPADPPRHPGASRPETVDARLVLERVRSAEESLAQLAGLAITTEDSALLRMAPTALEKLTRTVAGLRARTLAAIEADGSWRADGQTKLEAWLSAHTNTSWAQSRREVDRARALDTHLPQFREALESGDIGTDHIDAAVRYTLESEARTEALGDPESGAELLARAAGQDTVAGFTRTLRSWAASTDATATQQRWVRDLDREHLTLTTSDGGVRISGWLTEEHGLVLRTALNAHTGRPAAGDTRSRSQRDAIALTGLARLALDSGTLRPAARVRPHLLVTVPAETHAALAAATLTAQHTAEQVVAARHTATGETPEAVIPGHLDLTKFTGIGPATFTTGTPLAPGQLARLMCDADLTRIIFEPDGEPLDVGRAKRTFTAGQTKAIIARDLHCQFPGCEARPEWCEAHHVIWWTRDGRTDLDNGILLCWTHHTEVHRLGLTITKYPDRWEYHTPDGEPHGTQSRDLSHTSGQPVLFGTAA